MKKEFVPYNLSLRLTQLGFDEPFNPFNTFYYRNGGLCEANKDAVEYFNSLNDEVVLAPLFQQAFRWFREKYNLIGLVEGGYDNGKNIFTYVIWDDFKDIIVDDYYLTYEEAELACITALINIVENKQQAKTK